MTYSSESRTNVDPLARSVVDRLRAVAGDITAPVPLHAPEFSGEEWAYVKDCLDTGWVSSVGSYVDRFETRVAEECGVSHGAAIVNGTAALEVALTVAGVRAGDEVMVPALTFVATANAVSHLGAIPHFVDSSTETLGLDPIALREHLNEISDLDGTVLRNRRTGRRISAIVPVHIFGHPVDMESLCRLATDFGLPVVEDAAEALGSRRDETLCGGFGDLAALSFNGNKIVTTGGGGAVVSRDPDLVRRAKHLSTTAKVSHRWAFVHDEIGWNFRMPNLNAALGCAQLDQLHERLISKRLLARHYIEIFRDLENARIFEEPAGCVSNYWLNTLVLDPEVAHLRDHLLETTNDLGFQCRPVWTLMHRLPMHAECPRAPLDVAEDLERRIVNLPSSANLGRALRK